MVFRLVVIRIEVVVFVESLVQVVVIDVPAVVVLFDNAVVVNSVELWIVVVILTSGITSVSVFVRTMGRVMISAKIEAIPTPSKTFFHISQLLNASQQL